MPERTLVLRLIALMVLAHLAFSGMRLTLTLWAVARGMSPLGVGLMLSGLMVMPMLTAVSMGRWCDRVGFRPPVQRGLILIATGGLLCAWAPHVAVMVLGSMMVGWGITMTQVAVTQAIALTSGPQGATSGFAGMSVGFSFSGFVGPLLAGLVIDHASHGWAYLSVAWMPAVGLWMLRSLHVPASHTARPARPADDDHAGRSLMSLGPIRSALLTAAMVALAWDLFNFFMPVHAAALGLSATAIGALAATYSVGSLGIRAVLGHLADRVPAARLLKAALGVTVLLFGLTPLASGLPQLLALALLTGLILGAGQPLAMTLLHENAPPGRAGEAIGMRSVIVSASQTFLPAVFGALGSALGTGPVFWVVAVVIMLTLAWTRVKAQA